MTGRIESFHHRKFDVSWILCAAHGYCDSIHGEEYLRIRAEYFKLIEAGNEPHLMARFIRESANFDPRIKAANESKRHTYAGDGEGI